MVNRRRDVLNRDRSINETFSSLRKEFKIMAIIEVQKIQKKYGDLEVLKSIDLSIEEGEVVCIIGPSGSGKSTFLRCLNRLEKITVVISSSMAMI